MKKEKPVKKVKRNSRTASLPYQEAEKTGKRARPKEWYGKRLEHAKALYLELLRLGKTEMEINAVEGVPAHNDRSKWKDDPAFAEECALARKAAADLILEDAEQKVALVYNMALDDAASPQLVSIADKILYHARWKVGKYNKEVYGDKIQQEITIRKHESILDELK